ncbi:hypothetical protein [Catellatospora bangladeshensis]|uniref:Uncharacterized protein n=1 Tax=Catellatospora bangladeshensis TaxID=310355 RepID=A0A8J3NPI1_9ACTN|nr:hypothetical protein [Catellatospora bangladeshensis]GIF85970.1 hypothetical protein Cba03nite_73190 [Catellatospora bangladeshensis]
MHVALFTPKGTVRLTPDAPGRMVNLMVFWSAVTLFVFGLFALDDEPGGAKPGHVTVLLVMLLFARGFHRTLTLGVFADETALYLCRAGVSVQVQLDQVEALTLRSDEQLPRVLWVDLKDGRRYPTPAYFGDVGTRGLSLTRAQMDTLIADLTRRLPAPATA